MTTAMGMVGRFAIAETEPGQLPALTGAAADAVAHLQRVDGVVSARHWYGFPFNEDPSVAPDMRLAAVSVLATDRVALGDAWTAATVGLDKAVARYDVEVEPVRASGTGWGIDVPPPSAPLGHDEPVLVVITGDLHPQHVDAFSVAGKPAIVQAKQHPGYLGGCGLITEKMVDITSFSCWRSARDARQYAYGVGAHRDAKDADDAGGWHVTETNFFVTYRVLEAEGELLGYRPFVTD